MEASAVRLPPHTTSALLRPAPVPHCGESGRSPNWPIETWAHSYTGWRRTVRRALPGFEVHSTGFSRERCLGACCWPFSSRLSAPGNAVYPQDAAPLAPPCRRVKDARYRPAHGCGVRGVVLFFVPPVEFTRSGAWGSCFQGFSSQIGSEISRICLSFGVLAYCIQEVGACGRVVCWLVH